MCRSGFFGEGGQPAFLLGLLDLVQFFEDGGGFGHGKPPITIPSHKPKSRALAAAVAADVKTVSAAALSSLLDARVLAVEGIYSEPLLAPFVRHYADAQKTRIAAVARQAVAEANGDIVAGVRMVATLDSRTSSVCRSLDGRVFPVDSGARPPFHINCRTSFVLVLKAEYAGREAQGKRASAGGAVSDGLSYYEWLGKQPAAFQDEVLGRTRGALFRRGGLSAKQFADLQLDRNFRPRTLDELRELIPEAFRQAGL